MQSTRDFIDLILIHFFEFQVYNDGIHLTKVSYFNNAVYIDAIDIYTLKKLMYISASMALM